MTPPLTWGETLYHFLRDLETHRGDPDADRGRGSVLPGICFQSGSVTASTATVPFRSTAGIRDVLSARVARQKKENVESGSERGTINQAPAMSSKHSNLVG